jgi:putative membrane protein
MAEPPHRDPVVPIVVGLLVLVALPLLWGVAMMATMGPWMMGGWGGWGGTASPWWGMVGLAFRVLVIAGLGLIAVWALRRSDASDPKGDERAFGILKERFARGELTHEQCEQMHRVLAGRE